MDTRKLAAQSREALRHHRAGRYARARALYERILRRAPEHPPALHGLGSILHAEGQHAEALPWLERAIAARPESAIYRNSLGNALRGLGRGAEAAAAYGEALRRDPGYARALHNLGALEQERGDLAAARRAFASALEKDPKLVPAARALAGLLLREGDPDAAEACLRRTLEAAGEDPDLLFDLGSLLRAEGRVDEAASCHGRVIALQPGRAEAYNDLGALHQMRGRVDPALACFDRARELQPELGATHFNRARLLDEIGRFEEASEAYQRAIALAPDLATEALCYLAVVRRRLCDWESESARTAELVRHIEGLLATEPERGLPALALNVLCVPARVRLAAARHLARGVERETRATRARCGFRHAPRRDPGRLRIGYVSPDFRAHAVGTLIHDLFRHHDRNAVAVHAYSLIRVDDPFQQSARRGADAFVDVSSESPAAIARRIHADGIDVLVDLAGYTTYSKTALFALGPAPVQLHWLGYLDTMGADFLPYILADERVIPETATDEFSETVVALPRGFAVSSPLRIPHPPSRAELGLPEDAFVFCCMNGLHKLDAETFQVWMRILERTPGSVLWLPDEGSKTARTRLAREAAARGVDASRLHFAPRAALPQYLARYRLADLFLDTFAYNAGATAVGALRAGLPVLTKPGDTFMSRMGASLCEAAGIPEMVCADAGAYEERAVSLATQPEALAALRGRLEAARDTAPLFDVAGFARQLEAAYRAIWRHHCKGSSARRIRVEASS